MESDPIASRERFQGFIHKRECDSGQKDYDIKMASRAIASFAIYNLASVDDEVAGNSVCDSSEDGGIDALCVNHSEKKVVIVQSKFNQAGNGTWSKDDFLSFKDACEKLQLEEYHRFDKILQNMSADITKGLESQDYKFLFVMAHTGKRGAAEEILGDMKKWQSELNDAALTPANTPQDELPFQVHLVSAEDLTEWLQVRNHVNVNLEDVELENYGRKNEPYTSYYGQISGDQILEWWQQYGSRLFSRNIRNLLGNTDVNESIKNTAINNPEMFWYYNNGITLLVSEILPHRRNATRGTDRGSFKLLNASIINGAQTVSTIGQIFTHTEIDNNLLSKIKIPIRFITVSDSDGDEIATAITKANNHQNRVLGRDFASQNQEQIRISKELAVENFQYQLLRTSEQNFHSDENVIDLDESLDALACLTNLPSTIVTLKSNRGRFFENLDGSLYKGVFNPTTSGIKVINSVIHLRVIEKLIENKLNSIDKITNRKSHLILTHSNRVISAVLLNSVLNLKNATEILEPDQDSLSKLLDQKFITIEQFIETNYTNAYPARFFGNVEKVTEILKELNQ